MKLPTDIDLDAINKQRFTYMDALEMLEDMRRLRRKSGWVCHVKLTEKEFVFTLFSRSSDEDDSQDREALFVVPIRTVHRTLWSSLYPNEPTVPQLRRWFLSEGGGLYRIAATVNEIPQDPEPVPEGASAWNLLLGEDDLD